MSLVYDSDGDLITLPSVSPSESGTINLWFYPTDDTARQSLWHHTGGSDLQMTFRGDQAGDPFACFRGGSVYWDASANAANFAAYGLNKWLAISFRYGGSSADLWLGDENNTPAAPSAYGVQATGNTAITTAGAIYVANNLVTTRWIRGRLGAYAWWNGTILSDTEVGAWWSNPFGFFPIQGATFPAPTVYGRPGSNGTTDVPDETGNGNTGTITGLSSPDRNPSIVFPRRYILVTP